MNKINLLPWRVELLRQTRITFRNTFILSVLAGLSCVIVLHSIINTKKSNQLIINQTIGNESANLDKQIIALAQLINHKQQLISEIEFIQNLQLSRQDSIRLLSELPALLPNGIYLTQLSQNNTEISFEGKTDSNQQVSLFMQAIAQSGILQSPILQIIKIPEKITDTVPVNDFTLTATLRNLSTDMPDAFK